MGSTKKEKKLLYSLALIPLLIILIVFGWFFVIMFEGEKPTLALEPLPDFLSKPQAFTISISDKKRGVKSLKVTIGQGARERTLFEEKFPFNGLFNRKGVHRYEKEFSIDPAALKLAQGQADLNIRVWDYSRRGGGDGNLTLAHHKMVVDTIPPAIRAISRMHNINVGGSGLIVYQTSSDAAESGIFVDDLFFPGFARDGDLEKGMHTCYFAIPYNTTSDPSIHLWAKDKAGNVSKTTFYHYLRSKRFRQDQMNITDRFLTLILPSFSHLPFGAQDSDIEKYLKINNELREESHLNLSKLREKTDPKKRWEGVWLRLTNAATMAQFGDRRLYYYKGNKVDEQDHLGIDLASLANSPVQASNSGRVIFADSLGIYGLTVVIDHGQGLSSLYAHLSKIAVALDQEVQKGAEIGYTGQTGLAGGDYTEAYIRGTEPLKQKPIFEQSVELEGLFLNSDD